MKKEVGQSIYDAIAGFADKGTWEGGKVLVTDMANGYISIAYGDEESTQQVPDSLKSEVEDMAGKIINGEIEVETTRQ